MNLLRYLKYSVSSAIRRPHGIHSLKHLRCIYVAIPDSKMTQRPEKE